MFFRILPNTYSVFRGRNTFKKHYQTYSYNVEKSLVVFYGETLDDYSKNTLKENTFTKNTIKRTLNCIF